MGSNLSDTTLAVADLILDGYATELLMQLLRL